jgi:signal transduction histidine kinase
VVSGVLAYMSLRARILAAVGSAWLLTLLVGLAPALSPGTRMPGMHVAVETGATLIAVLAAVLVYGRYESALDRRDLVLTAALAVFAVANLVLGVIPALLTSVPEVPMAWAGVVTRVLAAALLAAAAFLAPGDVRRPAAAARRCFVAGIVATVTVTAAALLIGERLPAPVASGSAPGDWFAGTPLMTVLGGLIVLLFGAATLGFARRAGEGGDALLGWLAIGGVLATFAWLHYVMYPSFATDWFAAGDVLRVGFFLCLFAGGLAELRRGQHALASQLVLEERQRIARDLHDGAAQDLAFIVHAARHLRAAADAGGPLDHIAVAAQHALENTREAIANLARPTAEPLTSALARAAREVGNRAGARVEVSGDAELEVPAATREALCRLVREAVTNAVRHGGASSVRVTVEETPELRVRIRDDGRGFDVTARREGDGGFGLLGMTQRVAQLGGDVRIDSAPGRGTEVLVRLQ